MNNVKTVGLMTLLTVLLVLPLAVPSYLMAFTLRAAGGPYGSFSRTIGIEAPIVGLIGKWFPTGAHKVGAAFGCLVPRLVTGHFDPTTQKSVWPSTGNSSGPSPSPHPNWLPS